MKNIFIVEDEIVVAKSMEQVLSHNGFNVIGIATSYEQAKDKLKNISPDLILCDINLNSEKTGIDLMRESDKKFNIPFIFISAYSDADILEEANKLSPCNYITKPFNDKQLLVSINRVFTSKSGGTVKPTKRELMILKLIARGYSSKQVAEELSVSFHTVETHRKNLTTKYDVKTMAELICLATDNGWIDYVK